MENEVAHTKSLEGRGQCGCVGLRVNNDLIIKYCPLHRAAPALLAVLTEGIGIHDSDDLAADLERMSNWMVSPEFADKLRAKAQAIRAATKSLEGIAEADPLGRAQGALPGVVRGEAG